MKQEKYKAPRLTKRDFEALFPNEEACLHKIFTLRYKNATVCEKCHKSFKYHKLNKQKLYSCQWCGHNIAPTSNTIFHKSSTPLKDWFYAIYLFSVSKNGVSAKELERQLGVTYKCAYRIGQRIRSLFDGDIDILKSIVEVDETYYGGKETNKHKSKRTQNTQGRSTKTKTPIVGAVERNGDVIAKVVENTESKVVVDFINENIEKGSEINTDEYRPYNKISRHGYIHKVIDHSKKMYCVDGVSTNAMEGFWSQLKRSIHGTYHSLSAKHLQNYVNEFVFRYNHRRSNQHIFISLIEQVGKPFQEVNQMN